MQYLMLLVLSCLLGINPAYSQEEKANELTEYAKQKIVATLKEQSQIISAINFDNIKNISTARKNKLKQVQTDITYNMDALINKTLSHQDVKEEVTCYNYPQTINATEYLLNYKTNLKLIQAVFIESTNSSPTQPTGLEDQTKNLSSARSSEKIYSAVTWGIYNALMENLNTANPERWDQTSFILTFGNAENFRQYIDKRCADIAELYSATENNFRNTGSSVSSTGVLEDIYLLLTGKQPVGPLAESESQLSDDMAYVSSKYLSNSYLFGLEVIKYNQLLYTPTVTEINNLEGTGNFKIEQLIVPKLEYKAVADALNMEVNLSEDDKNTHGPKLVTVPELSFKEKYNPSFIPNTITELNSKNNANYFTPYIKLLSTTETIVGDYANHSMKLSDAAQVKAYAIASEVKGATIGCEVVLAALSFVPTAGIGSAGMMTMIGLGAIDETRAISQEIYNNVPTSDIVKNHTASIALYAWMAATKTPIISKALSKAPLLRLGISSYFAYDLAGSLVQIAEQKKQISEAVISGQMTQAEAKLQNLALLRSFITTATFFTHTIKGMPAEIQASSELIKTTIIPKVEKYIDIITDVEKQGIVLVQLADGRVIPVGEKVKIVLDEFNKRFSENPNSTNLNPSIEDASASNALAIQNYNKKASLIEALMKKYKAKESDRHIVEHFVEVDYFLETGTNLKTYLASEVKRLKGIQNVLTNNSFDAKRFIRQYKATNIKAVQDDIIYTGGKESLNKEVSDLMITYKLAPEERPYIEYFVKTQIQYTTLGYLLTSNIAGGKEFRNKAAEIHDFRKNKQNIIMEFYGINESDRNIVAALLEKNNYAGDLTVIGIEAIKIIEENKNPKPIKPKIELAPEAVKIIEENRNPKPIKSETELAPIKESVQDVPVEIVATENIPSNKVEPIFEAMSPKLIYYLTAIVMDVYKGSPTTIAQETTNIRAMSEKELIIKLFKEMTLELVEDNTLRPETIKLISDAKIFREILKTYEAKSPSELFDKLDNEVRNNPEFDPEKKATLTTELNKLKAQFLNDIPETFLTDKKLTFIQEPVKAANDGGDITKLETIDTFFKVLKAAYKGKGNFAILFSRQSFKPIMYEFEAVHKEPVMKIKLKKMAEAKEHLKKYLQENNLDLTQLELDNLCNPLIKNYVLGTEPINIDPKYASIDKDKINEFRIKLTGVYKEIFDNIISGHKLSSPVLEERWGVNSYKIGKYENAVYDAFAAYLSAGVLPEEGTFGNRKKRNEPISRAYRDTQKYKGVTEKQIATFQESLEGMALDIFNTRIFFNGKTLSEKSMTLTDLSKKHKVPLSKINRREDDVRADFDSYLKTNVIPLPKKYDKLDKLDKLGKKGSPKTDETVVIKQNSIYNNEEIFRKKIITFIADGYQSRIDAIIKEQKTTEQLVEQSIPTIAAMSIEMITNKQDGLNDNDFIFIVSNNGLISYLENKVAGINNDPKAQSDYTFSLETLLHIAKAKWNTTNTKDKKKLFTVYKFSENDFADVCSTVEEMIKGQVSDATYIKEFSFKTEQERYEKLIEIWNKKKG